MKCERSLCLYFIIVNSLPTGPYKRKSLMIYDFAGSYRQLGACYVDENTTIRFSEKLYPNS